MTCITAHTATNPHIAMTAARGCRRFIKDPLYQREKGKGTRDKERSQASRPSHETLHRGSAIARRYQGERIEHVLKVGGAQVIEMRNRGLNRGRGPFVARGRHYPIC